jgi:predicted urease superfamily metal-dependent hydrolase
MSDTIETATPEATEAGVIAYLFTNNPQQAALMQSMLGMFYQGVYDNTIGVMSALNKETNKEELVIVGVQHDGEITNTFPLAKVLSPEEAFGTYICPDGKGGWLGEEDAPEQLEFDFGEQTA